MTVDQWKEAALRKADGQTVKVDRETVRKLIVVAALAEELERYVWPHSLTPGGKKVAGALKAALRRLKRD